MASAGGLRAITPAEPSAAFAPVDIDDDETSSEAVPSHHSLGEQSDNAGVDNGPGCSKYCSLTSSGVTQQLGPGGAAGEDTSLAQLGRSRGIVDYRENHSVETSGASKMGSAGGPGKAGSTADSHASTGTSSKPYRKTAGNGQRCGREYRAADSISEGTTPVESPPPTGRGKGVVADEGWGMVAGGPEQRSASTAAVVPCPPDACAAHQQHHHSAAVDRGENKGVSAAAVTVESNVCGWEPRRPLSGKKHLASAGAPVYTAGESPRDRYPSSAPALKPWSDALVEGEKLPPEVQAHVAVQTRDVSATTSAEVELPSATTTSSTSASTLCLQRSPPERTHGDGDVEHEREEQRSGGNGGDGGGVVADHHTTRPRSWELDFQQRRREVMITDAAIGGEGWRRQEHETRRSSEESARVAKHKEVNGEEHEDGRMRSPPAAENAEVVPPASCASGEDTDDEPLWAAAWKAPKRSRDLRGERDPATRVQSDRWTELKGSIPKMEGRVPSGTHGVSSTSDPGRSGCAPALLTSYVLKSNAPVHRQLAGVKFRLSSPSDEAKGPLNGPAGDRLDRSSIAVSGEVCPDSQDSDRGEGRGEDSASAAIAPDRSTTTSPEDLAAAARRVPVERAPLPDVKTRSALACGEPTATALAAASRRGNVEAENSTPVTGGMAGQGPSTASKDEALHTRDMRREGGFSQGHSGGGVSSRSSSSGSGGASDVDDYVPPTVALMHRARQHAGELSARSGVEKAAAALAAVPAAAKAAKEATISAGRPIIPGVPPGAIVDDAETSAGEDCPVEVGIGDSGELVYSFRKSGRPRRGKWSRLEEEFAKRIINDFDDGVLDAPAGIGLRQLLASKLRCEVMRVSKKFSGWACVGKRSFRPIRYADGRAARAQASLYALEQRWLKSFVPSSTLLAKPPAFEPSGARPLPASRSLMRLVPAPPAVERDGGVGSLKKTTNPAQVWLDRARKALARDSSTSAAMASLVREGRFFVPESGERGVGGVRGGSDAGTNGTQDNGYVVATERPRREVPFPLPRVGFDSSLEARRHHSGEGAPHTRSQPGLTPRQGGDDDEELRRWAVHRSDKASSVGASRPVDQRHRQQQQQQMEPDRAKRSDLSSLRGEHVRPRVSHDRGVDMGGTRPDTRASPPPSPRAQYSRSDGSGARDSDDGRGRSKPHFGWTSPNQQPGPYAPPQRRAQEQSRLMGLYAREQGGNHTQDLRVGSPRDMRSSWQRRQAELHQDARGTGSAIVGGAGAGAGGDVVSAPLSPIFSGRRDVGENVDVSMKIASSMTASAAPGSVGGWVGGPMSPSTADGQDRVRVQSARPPQPRSPCTISRPNEDTGPALGRSEDYPQFRGKVISPSEGRVGGEGRMGGDRALHQRGRVGGSTYASAAWHQGSLPRPGSEFDCRETLEGGRSSSPVVTAATRRPEPFRLKPPSALPPHLRVEHDGDSFFPGDGHKEETAKGYRDYSKPPSPSPQQRPPLPPQPQQQQQQRINSKRRSSDGYRPGGSLESEGDSATTEMRSYWEGKNREQQRPFKSRRVEIEIDGGGSGGVDRHYDNDYRNGYQSGHPDKRSPSEGGDSATVVKQDWRQYGTDRELTVEGTFATARSTPTGLADVPNIPDGVSVLASSSRVIGAQPHSHDHRFKFESPYARGDMWEDSRAQESHFHGPTRGFVVPAGGHLVLRVEASPELGRSSGIIREPYAACQD